MQESGKIAIEYRKKYGPEMPSLKLARIMYAENNLLFSTLDSARSALRRIEGKNGKESRARYKHNELFMSKDRPKNPYNLPKSEEVIWEPFKLNYKRVGVLSDIHIPYHNISALTVAIDYLKACKIDCLLLNGDAIDCFI